MRYGFAQYRRVVALRPGRAVARAKVVYFGDRTVDIEPARRVPVTVRRGERVRTRIDAPRELHGPLAAGAEVGRATVLVEGRPVRSVPLVTASAVPHAGILRKLVHWVTRPLAVIVILAVAILLAELRRRRIADADAARRRRRQAARLD
jgi:D-alanyl-D-alanine carboxypeptidase (penicillin-binding protein 5/6)